MCICTQLCPTLWNPMDCSTPGSSAQEIFQTRLLEWVAISSSKGPSQPKDWTWISSLQVNSLPLSHLGSQAYEQKTFLTVLEAGGPSFGCSMVRLWWRPYPFSGLQTSHCVPTWWKSTGSTLEPFYTRNIQFSTVSLNHVWLFVTPWTAACQASLSITNFRNINLLKIF